MKRVVFIQYGELSTKKGNRNFFVKTLSQNIRRKLEGLDVSIWEDLSRMTITFKEDELDTVLLRISKIFGIHAYHVAYQVDSTMDAITEVVSQVMKLETFQTFKVETRRSNKEFPKDSMEMSRYLGGVILKSIPNIKVDVHHPDVICHVEIRRKETYVYTNLYHGLGGYPVGTQPRAMLMLSGGIDSPVAGYLALKRGIPIHAVYFEAIPHTSIEARNKVLTLATKLAEYTNKIHVSIVPFTEIQEAIYKNCDPNYVITIMRRMMYRIMERLAIKNHALAIVNGESIGQVASQTLHSMFVINQVTSFPVIRPVACFDKLEIIDLARKIDTYETSILPYEDCCTVFVPKHPVIAPTLEEVLRQEAKFSFLPLIDDTMQKVFTITVPEKVKKEEEILF